MPANEYYTENSYYELIVAKVIGGSDRVELIEFYQDGQKSRTYRVASELFKSKKQATKYFRS